MSTQNVTVYDNDGLNQEPIAYDTQGNLYENAPMLTNEEQPNNSYNEAGQTNQNLSVNNSKVEIKPNTPDAAQKEDGEIKNTTETTTVTTTKTKKTHKICNISIGLLIFTIGVFIGFVFCVAGNPIGMFDKRTDRSCISIWGNKPNCLKTWFRHQEWNDKNGKKCDKAHSLIEAAQAFSVMSIIGGFLTTIVALLEIAQFAEIAVVAVIISSINTVATLVTWATMTAMYYSNLCGVTDYRRLNYRYGNGLILYVTAWCVQMVANIALIIDIAYGNVK